VEYPAEQLGIDDPACLKDYADRRMTRFEHQAEITQEYGLAAFADVEAELAVDRGPGVDDRRRTEGDLRGRGGVAAGMPNLLPGITGLERLVAAGREVADKRLWNQLAGRLDPAGSASLLALQTAQPHEST